MSVIHLKPIGQPDVVSVKLETELRNGDALSNVHWGENQAEVQVGCTSPGSGWIRRHGETLVFHAVREKDTLHVWIRGRVHTFKIIIPSARRASAVAGASTQEQLTAPMPGTVLKIRISEGDPFEAHQPLIILESMKMEMTLSVPHEGRVKKITCHEGDLVEMGAVLAKLSAASDE